MTPFPPSFFFFSFLNFFIPPSVYHFVLGFLRIGLDMYFVGEVKKKDPGYRILARISFANVYLCVALLFSPIYSLFSPISHYLCL